MFGLMRTSAHRKIYIEQGEAYRKEIEEAYSERNRTRQMLERFADFVVPTIQTHKHYDGKVQLYIEIDPRAIREALPQDLLILIQDRIMERLLGLNKDYRGDLRMSKKERLFIQ